MLCYITWSRAFWSRRIPLRWIEFLPSWTTWNARTLTKLVVLHLSPFARLTAFLVCNSPERERERDGERRWIAIAECSWALSAFLKTLPPANPWLRSGIRPPPFPALLFNYCVSLALSLELWSRVGSQKLLLLWEWGSRCSLMWVKLTLEWVELRRQRLEFGSKQLKSGGCRRVEADKLLLPPVRCEQFGHCPYPFAIH